MSSDKQIRWSNLIGKTITQVQINKHIIGCEVGCEAVKIVTDEGYLYINNEGGVTLCDGSEFGLELKDVYLNRFKVSKITNISRGVSTVDGSYLEKFIIGLEAGGSVEIYLKTR